MLPKLDMSQKQCFVIVYVSNNNNVMTYFYIKQKDALTSHYSRKKTLFEQKIILYKLSSGFFQSKVTKY